MGGDTYGSDDESASTEQGTDTGYGAGYDTGQYDTGQYDQGAGTDTSEAGAQASSGSQFISVSFSYGYSTPGRVDVIDEKASNNVVGSEMMYPDQTYGPYQFYVGNFLDGQAGYIRYADGPVHQTGITVWDGNTVSVS